MSRTLGHRTADVTCVSCSTVDRVRKEKLGRFSHQRRLWNVGRSIGGFDQAAIRLT